MRETVPSPASTRSDLAMALISPTASLSRLLARAEHVVLLAEVRLPERFAVQVEGHDTAAEGAEQQLFAVVRKH